MLLGISRMIYGMKNICQIFSSVLSREGNITDKQGYIVAIAHIQLQVLRHALDLGISDVGAVKVAQKVDDKKDRNNMQIKLPQETSLYLWVDMQALVDIGLR